MDVNPRERLILALDVASADEAKRLVDRIGQEIAFVKIGLELFTAAGPDIVRWAIQNGKQVFLDLKLLDIGETVKRATAAAAELGVRFLTTHTGSKTVRAAVEGRGASQLKILAVTILTNFLDSDLEELGIPESMPNAVLRRARLATAWGADGLIASGTQLEVIRMTVGSEVLLVTPGIRPAGTSPDDQASVSTPSLALAAGLWIRRSGVRNPLPTPRSAIDSSSNFSPSSSHTWWAMMRQPGDTKEQVKPVG